MKTNISVEYCHIYIDETFNTEHAESIKLLKKVESSIDKTENEISRLLLIDNYSPVTSILNEDNLAQKLSELEATPDYTCYEGDLDQMAIVFLKLVKKDRLRRSYEKYLGNHNGYVPCSLFIATWYAVRLGLLFDNKIKIPKASKTISILHSRFKDVEAKGIELLENSEYADCINNIEQIFFDESSSSKSPKF